MREPRQPTDYANVWVLWGFVSLRGTRRMWTHTVARIDKFEQEYGSVLAWKACRHAFGLLNIAAVSRIVLASGCDD